MRPAQRLGLPAGLQPFERVLANDVQHPEARLAAFLALLHQALIHQPAQPVQQIQLERRRPLGRDADRLGRLQRAAADEDRQTAKEQRSAGVSRSSLQAMVARIVCWRSSRSRAPPVSSWSLAGEPGQQRLGRQQLHAGGRQLDRQRQPVQPRAYLGDGRRVGGRHGEVGPGACARSMKSATAAYCAKRSGGRPPRSGRGSGPRGTRARRAGAAVRGW